MPADPRHDRLERVGVVVTLGGIALLVAVFVLQGPLGGFAPLVGGLALNATIVGPALVARRSVQRLAKRLPRWLGW